MSCGTALRLELAGRTFTEMVSVLHRLLKLREVKRACIDATGLGLQLAEQAKEKFGWKVEPVTFTAPVKEELAFGLRADFEDRMVRIVSDDKLLRRPARGQKGGHARRQSALCRRNRREPLRPFLGQSPAPARRQIPVEALGPRRLNGF